MHDSVTVHMAASPMKVWDLVSDVTKIGRYSPRHSRPSGSKARPGRR